MADQPGPYASPTISPLVGREREQAALRAALATALAGHGALVLIGGEAGIGKTTLAEWALTEARQRGAMVLGGRCYDLSETPPYGPWREALTRAPHDADLPVLPPSVPPSGRVGGALAGQDAIIGRVVAYLAALAGRQPVAILLDDLHWADPASLDLPRALARMTANLPLLLLVTYRSDEIIRHHPLYQLLPVLVRETHAQRLDPRRLERDGLRDQVRARYGSVPDRQEGRRRLYRRTTPAPKVPPPGERRSASRLWPERRAPHGTAHHRISAAP